MKPAFVYFLTLTRTGIFYIGSTYYLDERIERHISELSRGVHHNQNLQRAWSGSEEVSISSIKFNSREEAYDFEDEHIKMMRKSPFNRLLANIGNDSRCGDNLTYHPFRDKIISKMVEKSLFNNSLLTQEERNVRYGRIGELNGMYGKTHTPEVKKRLSEINIGHIRNKGCKLSDSHKEKISQKAKLRIGSKNPFYNKKHTQETKDLIRKSRLGKLPTNIRTISADGKIFNSCADASRYFNVSQGLITHRLKSIKYPNWFYFDKTIND